MQSLLLERAVGKLSPLDFATTFTESLYSNLRQVPNRFPPNCHHSAAVNSLCLEKSGYRYMLSGCADSSIKLWDLKPEEDEESEDAASDHTTDKKGAGTNLFPAVASVPRKSAHEFGVSAVKWWPQDTGMFLSASFDHTVKVWDTNSMEVVHTFDLGSRVYAFDVCGHQAGEYMSQALIAVASDQPFIRLVDLRSASSAHTLQGHKGKTISIAWHPQNPHLLGSGGYDGEAKVWDIRRSNSCIARLDMTKTNARPALLDGLNLGATSVKAHLGPVNALVWDELGQTLYTAGNDDKVRVWDMISTNAPPINKLVNFGPLTRNKYLQNLPLVLSPRQETEVQHVLFASDSGDVLVFRALDGKLVSRLQRSGTASSVRTASIAYAGPFSASFFCGTMDGEILTWTGHTPEPDFTHYGEPDDVLEEKPQVADVDRLLLYNDPYFRHLAQS